MVRKVSVLVSAQTIFLEKTSHIVRYFADLFGYSTIISCFCRRICGVIDGIPYLNALYKGKKTICERVLKLDAERFKKGDLPLPNLLSKYCSYIMASNRE